MSEVVPTVASAALLVLGLSYLLQARMWARYSEEIQARPHQSIPVVLLLLLAGLVIVTTHYEGDGWPFAITVLGWVLVAKGVIYLLFPQIITLFSSPIRGVLHTYIRIVGGVVTLIGAAMMYFVVTG